MPQLDLFVLIAFVAIGQGLFLSVYFFLKKKQGNKQATWLLSLIIFTFVFHLFVDVLHYSRFVFSFPQFFGLTYFFRYAYGPLIFLYVLSITVKEWKLKWVHILHFVPFLVLHINLLPKYLWSNDVKIAYLERKISAMGEMGFQLKELVFSEELIHFFWFHLQPLTYLLLAIYFLRLHQRRVNEEYSFHQKVDLYWLRNIFYGFALFWASSFLIELFVVFQYDYLWMRMMFLSGHIVVISIMALNQPPIGVRLLEKKYKSSNLREEEAENYQGRVLTYMVNHKPYLKPELSLKGLSEEIGLNQRYLSQVINEHLGKNFYQFVNEYRILEAQSRLCDPRFEHYSIEGIGQEVGFKSKASFYRVFKQQVGVTPKAFQESVRSDTTVNLSLIRLNQS